MKIILKSLLYTVLAVIAMLSLISPMFLPEPYSYITLATIAFLMLWFYVYILLK